MSFTVAKVIVKADLSGLTLEKAGVLNAVLTALPTSFNGVSYNDTFQHKLLVTNQVGLKSTMINLRTVNAEYGSLQTTALVDKLILSNQDLLDTLVSACKLSTSVTNPVGMVGKADFNFFYDINDNNELKVAIYFYKIYKSIKINLIKC